MNIKTPPIALCHACDEPLVSTMEFPGKEWICVVCRRTYEYFGAKQGESTPELMDRHNELRDQYLYERRQRERA